MGCSKEGLVPACNSGSQILRNLGKNMCSLQQHNKQWTHVETENSPGRVKTSGDEEERTLDDSDSMNLEAEEVEVDDEDDDDDDIHILIRADGTMEYTNALDIDDDDDELSTVYGDDDDEDDDPLLNNLEEMSDEQRCFAAGFLLLGLTGICLLAFATTLKS